MCFLQIETEQGKIVTETRIGYLFERARKLLEKEL